MFVPISAAVEGAVDEAVIRRLVTSVGGYVTRVYLGNGKDGVLKNLPGYNHAACFAPWVVLLDLDDECCAPPCRQRWLPHPARLMCLRIAVRAIESWLLADRERIADLLRVSVSRVPENPESLPDPKGALIDLARQSRSRRVRNELVPRPAAGRRVGPSYTTQMIAFVQDTERGWRPEIAAVTAAESLDRCLRAIRALVDRASAESRPR